MRAVELSRARSRVGHELPERVVAGEGRKNEDPDLYFEDVAVLAEYEVYQTNYLAKAIGFQNIERLKAKAALLKEYGFL